MEKFGVFADFAASPETREFKSQNILYGWNYSGKTTLSKLFNAIGCGALPDEFADARITLQTDSALITAANISAAAIPVKVFNSDYVRDNLSWDGESFQPILLLGEDTIEAEKRIAWLEQRLTRYRSKYQLAKTRIAEQEQHIAAAKTAAAKRIKQFLQLVDPFTSIHLSQQLEAVDLLEFDDLAAPDLERYLAIVHTGSEGILPELKPISARLALKEIEDAAGQLVSHTPALANVISYLKDHAEVAAWVEAGLELHEHKQNCEFCGNEIAPDRWDALSKHFSRDLFEYKAKLAKLSTFAKVSKLDFPPTVQMTLQVGLRDKFSAAWSQLLASVERYNGAISVIEAALAAKVNDPFCTVVVPNGRGDPVIAVLKAIEDVNRLIDEHNADSKNFKARKAEAIERLKLQYASEFARDEDLANKRIKSARWNRHLGRFAELGASLKEEILVLKAQISTAQKGREQINRRITGLLGSDNIQISVVDVAGEERFQLSRSGAPARNLSEGEKTAISFAFFLTQLEEVKDLSSLIVFIDDPISSLDSNHVFQVFSIIRETFFRRDASGTWKTTCSQLFLSTHNFEFFSLLRKLPCNQNHSAYYLVRRVSTTGSTLENLPDSILKYPSEYHYLFSLLHEFHLSSNKADIEKLLALPNAIRRFLELYTYTRIPSALSSTVDQRAAVLFGDEAGVRIIKLLHHFSHLESMDRLALHTNLISDIERVVDDVLEQLKRDPQHFEALTSAL